MDRTHVHFYIRLAINSLWLLVGGLVVVIGQVENGLWVVVGALILIIGSLGINLTLSENRAEGAPAWVRRRDDRTRGRPL